MIKKGTIHYRVHDTFLLRSPLLPLEVLRQISSSKDVEPVLHRYYSRDECLEALYLASPGLYRKALASLNRKENDRKAKRKLLQYLIRMASRCTPFGSFAGVCTGTFAPGYNVFLEKADEHNLHFRPDMQVLCQLAQQIQGDYSIRENLKYTINTSLYRLGEEYRFIEHLTNPDGGRKYLLSSTQHIQALEKIIVKVVGYRGFNSLVSILMEDGFDANETREYIHTLIDNQVLVSELEPSVSGKGFYLELKEKLGEGFSGNAMADLFCEINRGLDSLPEKRSQARLATIDSLMAKTKSFTLELKENAFIQADMKLNTRDCCLDNSLRKELIEVTGALLKMSRKQTNPLMSRFKESFVRRYGEREIPLSLAMDAEAGPGYLPDDAMCGNDALLDGLTLPPKDQGAKKLDWSEVDTFLFTKLQEAIMEGKFEVELDEQDLVSLPEPANEYPTSISLLVRILTEGKNVSAKPTLYFNSAGGSSAMKLAGRFAYLDSNLENCLIEIANIEQKAHDQALFAEIIHLPEERTGNVLLRPVFYPYEIPFLAKPTVEEGFCLPIEDLLVKVREDKVLIRSNKLDRYIIPRLSNAHNYSIGKLSLYRFLCDLQTEGHTTYFGFSWGPLEEECLFLPRVLYKGHILSAAQWNLPQSDIMPLKDASDLNIFFQGLIELREKYNIPREIVLMEYDNELWLDLENHSCCEILFHEFKKRNKLKIMEFLHSSKESIVKSEEGIHANEFLFFLYQDI